MKKIISLGLVFLMLFSLFSCASAEDSIKVVVNGKEVLFDVAPKIIEKRTMVPVRAVFEMLGAVVSWDDKTNTATGKRGDIEVSITVNSNTMIKNGEKITLDVSAKEIGGRVLVPVRAISESFGATVSWEEKTKTVTIVENNGLLVTFLDVGQADSIFIEMPSGETMLIDAGTKKMGKTVADFIKSKGYNKVDYVIATHPHEDHIGGMSYVLENIDVGTFYMPEAATTTNVFSDMLDAVQNNGCKAVYAESGNVVFEKNGVKATFLAPNSSSYESLNNYSAVLKLTYGKSSFLFMGDAESISENEILNSGYDVDVDVLKVGHHGSSTSSSYKFIKSVTPTFGIISCGLNNSYGHPHKETLNTLGLFNTKLYYTRGSGNVEVYTDGENYTFNKKEIVTTDNTENSETVYITKTGKRYHKDGCSGLSKSKIPISLSEATEMGYTPCGNCY